MDERTIEILNRFQQSWADTERFYAYLTNDCAGFERFFLVRQFLDDLKQRGGEQLYRLGTSMHILCISRSVNFGLRPEQKYISIETFDTEFEVCLRDGKQVYRRYKVNYLSDEKITRLFKTLKHVLVD